MLFPLNGDLCSEGAQRHLREQEQILQGEDVELRRAYLRSNCAVYDLRSC